MKNETLFDKIMRIVTFVVLAVLVIWGFQRYAIVANIIFYFGVVTLILGAVFLLIRLCYKRLKERNDKNIISVNGK